MKTPTWSHLHEEDKSDSDSRWPLDSTGPPASAQVQAERENGRGGRLDRLAGQAVFRPMANEDRKKVFHLFMSI
jgi:hypothetical protein